MLPTTTLNFVFESHFRRLIQITSQKPKSDLGQNASIYFLGTLALLSGGKYIV